MSPELLGRHGGAEHMNGVTNISQTINQYNQFHGDVTNSQHNYFGGQHTDWKPSRRCASVDFGRLSKHFCGREQELERLNGVLEAGTGSLRCAIQGISGLGKSHLAIKYGKVSYESDKYTHVFWISSDTETKLLGGLESILVKLDHPAQFESDQKTKVEVARRWLEDAAKDQRWLLILDSATRRSFETLRNTLPNRAPHGHILLTTQFEDITKEFINSQPNPLSLLRLKPLAIDDGVALLIASSHLPSDGITTEDREKARQLVQRTGCLPLAITFAAACATSTGSLPELLDWTSDDQLMMITEYKDALADTDQRVIKQFFDRQVANIESEPLALALFRILSFLDNSSISVKMLWRGVHSLQVEMSENNSTYGIVGTFWRRGVDFVFKTAGYSSAADFPLLGCRMSDVQKATKTLAEHNLIQLSSPGLISMHDLTNHMSLRSMEVTKVASRYQGFACRLILSSFQAIQDTFHRDNWHLSDETIPHFFKLSADVDQSDSRLDIALHKPAEYLRDRGRYSDAGILYDRLLIMRKRTFGLTHSNTLTTMHNLAEVYSSQGRFQGAEELLRYVLEERIKQYGPEHAASLVIMANLAAVYQDQYRFKEAMELSERILEGTKKRLGPEHPTTLTAMNSLTLLYGFRDRRGEAEELYQQVLDAKVTQLGPPSPSTLAKMKNLASVHVSQGRFGEAEKLYQQVLDAKITQLGPSSPSTFVTMNSLAGVYVSQGRFGDAEELFKRVLEGEKQHDPSHPSTLKAMNNLASIYRSQGRLQEAEELFQDVLDAMKQKLGPTHPDALETMSDLADLYDSQDRSREAGDFYELVVDGWIERLGLRHPKTLLSAVRLSLLYESQGRNQEAEELPRRFLV